MGTLKLDLSLAGFEDKANEAAQMLKALSNEKRLMILCKLLEHREMSVNALIDHVRDLSTVGAIHSVAVNSEGRYGFAEGVWAGMPVKTTAPGAYEVITSYEMDDFAKSKIKITNDELVGERDTVKDMLG